MNILIADAEKLIVKGLKHSLEQNDFCVYTAFDCKEALNMINCNQLDFILLDIMLPKHEGITDCKKIKEKHDVPIIMLINKEDNIDKLLRQELGADDYVIKPFNTRELIARINEVYRKHINKHDNAEIMQHGSLKINFTSGTALIDNIEIVLTSKEFDLLKTFIESPGRVFTRENLFDIVWKESIFDARIVDVHIKSLREKIEEEPSKPQLIKTKWGVGYYLKRV